MKRNQIAGVFLSVLCYGMLLSGCAKESYEELEEYLENQETLAQAEERIPEPEAPKNEFARGVWTENVHHNVFADLTFTKPDDWTEQTEEEMLENVTVDELAFHTYDMEVRRGMAESIFVMYDNLRISTIVADTMTPDFYLAKWQEDMISQQQENMTVTPKKGPATVTIGAYDYNAISMEIKTGNLTIYNFSFARRVDDYMVVICAMVQTDSMEDIIEMFS